MITLQDISYSVGGRNVLCNVSFTVGDTEKVGLVGINGVGKSTILRLICGTLLPNSGTIIFPRSAPVIGYMPQTVDDLRAPADQTVFDFLASGRPLVRIEKQIEQLTESMSELEGARLDTAIRQLDDFQQEFESWGGYNAEDELLQIISGMRLQGIDLNAKVATLSGGEKSKVSFSRMLYSRPAVLLLDEPTNHLDEQSKKWLMAFLKQYRGSVLIVSHDSAFIDSVVSKIVRLDEDSGEAAVFNCGYDQHLTITAQRREEQNRAAVKHQAKEDKLRDYLERTRGLSGKKGKQVQSRKLALAKLQQQEVKPVKERRQVSTQIVAAQESGFYPVIVKNLHFGYQPGREVISGLSFHLSKNERFVVAGPNGAGKSTLLKLIAGELRLQRGEIVIDRKTQVSYYDQEQKNLNPDNSVLTEVARVAQLPQRELRSLLARFLFPAETVNQKVGTLSLGERSRLALAKITLQGRNLLLLDEPTNHLDPATSAVVCRIIREYNGTVLVVSHDIGFIEALQVQRMLLLPQGAVTNYVRSQVQRFQE